MKKIAAILALAIFLISLIPVSIAQDDSDEQKRLEDREKDRLRALEDAQKERLDAKKERLKEAENLQKDKVRAIKVSKDELLKERNFAELSKERLERVANLDRTRLEEFSNLNSAELKSRLEKIKIVKVDAKLEFRKRIVAEQRIALAEEMFNDAEERLHEAKEKLEKRRKLLLEAKSSGDEGAIIEHAKQGLLRAADAIISHLEKVKSKAQESEDLSEEEANEIVADIDAKIAEINDAKAAIEAATTKEDIREQAKKINAAWKRIKVKAEQHARSLINGGFGGILKRSEALERKIDRILAEMEERGIDVSSIEEKVAEFSDKVAGAREKLKQSNEKFKEAKSTGIDEERKALLEEAKTLAREAHDALKEAHDILNEIIREIKAVYKEADFEEEEELVEVVEEDEQEEDQQVEVEVEGLLTEEQQSTLDSL